MVRFVIALATISTALLQPLAAAADQSGFVVACEPTEQSDVGRVIRQKIYDALEATKLYKKISLKSKVVVLDKLYSTKSTNELQRG